jgi:predicted nucleic acid-binding protein
MSDNGYVDTGVLGSYYFPETFSDAAESMLRSLDEVVISELTEVEFFSLAAKKLRTDNLSEADIRRVLMKFQSHIDEGFYRRVTVESADYRHARSYLSELKTGLRTEDAIHVAVAQRHGLDLITADRVQAESAAYFGVAVQRIAV